jgi:3-oxoacyl-[acyl-carrier protein] reductase
VTRSLEGKRALVTGGASGIGRATVLALAGEGCRVAVADRAPRERIDEVARRAADAGGQAFPVPVDVAEEAQVRAMFDAAIPRLGGGLDILVNNAGILIEKPLLETSADDFDRLIGVNLRGAFLVGREAIRFMVGQGGEGRVINIASELAYLGRENCSVYCASKGGVLSLTRSWAREFAPKILVNAVAPGPTGTAMLEAESTSPETLAKESQNPLGRIARPEEIAAAVVFLAGPGATFMTGQCVSPNGGAAMF